MTPDVAPGLILTPEQLIDRAIKRRFSVTEEDLSGRSRSVKVKIPRHLRWYLLKKHTGMSLKQIATSKGLFTHPTVINGIKKIQNLIDTHDVLMEQITPAINEVETLIKINRHEIISDSSNSSSLGGCD